MTILPPRRFAAIALVLACGKADRSAAIADSLLRSTDTVAVYAAGVAAFRAEDYAAARRYWQRATNLHDYTAASKLGYLFYHGLGGEPDSTTGTDLWKYAALHGVAEAHVHLARVIAQGDGQGGTMLEGYSHAVAAEILAAESEDERLAVVGRDASALKAEIAARLSEDDRVLADSQGHGWARRP